MADKTWSTEEGDDKPLQYSCLENLSLYKTIKDGDRMEGDRKRTKIRYRLGFSCGSAGKKSAFYAQDLGSIPGLGRSPGEGKGYPLQYSGLENSMEYRIPWISARRSNQSILMEISPECSLERLMLKLKL